MMEVRRPKPADREFGARVKKLRREIGMSQQQLAALAGVSFQQLQKYENGTNRTTISCAVEIAHGLDTNLEVLVRGLEKFRKKG